MSCYSVAAKKRLANAMIQTYARLMVVEVQRISVAIRELGEGGIWRIADEGGEPEHARLPAARDPSSSCLRPVLS